MSLKPKALRLKGLPEELIRNLKDERLKRNWSQAELATRTGLTQTHISGIESGRVVPRFDTLLDLVRVLGQDLLLIPRSLVPVVQSLIRDHRHSEDESTGEGERPLYAVDNNEDLPAETRPKSEI